MAANKRGSTQVARRPAPTRAPARARPEERSISIGAIAIAALVLAALWAFDLTILRTPVLTPFVNGPTSLPATTPIYAFWMPQARIEALVFVAVFGALVMLAPRLCDAARTPRAIFVGALMAFAIALPLALFVVRDPLDRLGDLLTVYRGEEVYFDALRIDSYRSFLRDYVSLMPRLSLHGQHFPPGNATWLYVVVRLFGPSTVAVGVIVLLAFALGMPLAYGTFVALAGERAARVGSLLLLATPSLVDFACTSMDAVFFTAALACTFLAARVAVAVREGTKAAWPLAAATGVVLFGAAFLSFSALPLGLMIGLYLAIAARRTLSRGAAALGVIGASFAGTALLLQLASGFSILDCASTAVSLNHDLMTRVLGRDPRELLGYMAYGNTAAFLIGSGVALVAAVGTRVRTGFGAWNAWTLAAAITLAVMCLGGLYEMETERIWCFAMPWLAAAAVSGGAIEDRSLRRLLVVGGAQTLAMEILLFTLW